MTNRERILRAIRDIERVQTNIVIGPTPYVHLQHAVAGLLEAARFALDESEQDVVRRET